MPDGSLMPAIAEAVPPGAVLGVEASIGQRRWIWRRSDNAAQERAGLAMSQRLVLPEMVGRLLAARGVDVETAQHFLEPTLRALLPDPSCMIDMDAAAARLARAVEQSETIGVFGDYDVDGACAAAVLTT
ncbi:MAG: hypothetical protein ACRYFY_08820, partial [Janthinobacterium lividum]